MSFTVVQVSYCQRNRVILPMIKQVIEKGKAVAQPCCTAVLVHVWVQQVHCHTAYSTNLITMNMNSSCHHSNGGLNPCYQGNVK
jgi:hypothetical protein